MANLLRLLKMTMCCMFNYRGNHVTWLNRSQGLNYVNLVKTKIVPPPQHYTYENNSFY